MACQDSNSPLNLIDHNQEAVLTCNTNCEYKANYPECDGQLTNHGDHLSIRLGRCGQTKFGGDSYILEEVRIYCPSLHKWKGKKADAELIIIHNNKHNKLFVKNKKLFVSIPLKKGSSSKWFDWTTVIPDYYTNTQSESVPILGANWTLNTIIPSGDGYYSYQGKPPFEICEGIVEYIVYDMDYATTIGENNLKEIQSKIKPNLIIKTKDYDSSSPSRLYYHTTNGLGLEDIVFECNDVEIDKEKTKKKLTRTTQNYTSNKDQTDTINSVIIGTSTFIGLLILASLWNKFIRKDL
jgi:carbonic anhydrase